MHLLSPAYAVFLVLGILPVLIHLHGRRRAQVRKLPTLLLLRASNRRVAQRTRLRHVLLPALNLSLFKFAMMVRLARAGTRVESAGSWPVEERFECAPRRQSVPHSGTTSLHARAGRIR